MQDDSPGAPRTRPSAGSAATGPGRRAVRRRSGIAWAGMALAALLAAPAGADLATGHPERLGDHWIGVEVALPLVVACWLAGPAARFVVDGRHLHIDTGLRRASVPRRLLGRFSPHGERVRLELTEGGRLDFRADSFLWEFAWPYHTAGRRSAERGAARAVAQIGAMLAEVPAGPERSPAVVVRSWRLGPIAVAVAAGVVVPVVLAVRL